MPRNFQLPRNLWNFIGIPRKFIGIPKKFLRIPGTTTPPSRLGKRIDLSCTRARLLARTNETKRIHPNKAP